MSLGSELDSLVARVARLEEQVQQLQRDGVAAGESLTPTQAGRVLGISQRTILRRIESGELSAYREGKVWRIRRADLDAYLAKKQPTEPDQPAWVRKYRPL